MDQAVAYWQIYTIVRPQDSVRGCENTVTLPSPFQVSSL